MLIVLVQIHVKEDAIAAFREATLANARASVQEAGIARFDVIQRKDDPTRFVLLEAYRSEDAPAAHKQTQHYATWRDTVASMMASPRVSHQYENLLPPDAGWEMPGAAASR
jgi:quinol monooxygenase YgiN